MTPRNREGTNLIRQSRSIARRELLWSLPVAPAPKLAAQSASARVKVRRFNHLLTLDAIARAEAVRDPIDFAECGSPSSS